MCEQKVVRKLSTVCEPAGLGYAGQQRADLGCFSAASHRRAEHQRAEHLHLRVTREVEVRHLGGRVKVAPWGCQRRTPLAPLGTGRVKRVNASTHVSKVQIVEAVTSPGGLLRTGWRGWRAEERDNYFATEPPSKPSEWCSTSSGQMDFANSRTGSVPGGK